MMTLSRRSALSLSAGISLTGALAASGSLLSRPAVASEAALQEAHLAAGRARAAYGLMLESGKLPAQTLAVAERIYERHRANEEALSRRSGSLPTTVERPDVRAAISSAQTPLDMLRLMRDVEVQALGTYLDQSSDNGDDSGLLAAAAADGAMNWALVNHILGESLPPAGLAAGGSLPLSGVL
ncbi:MAG TPA: hypothetical protein VKY54_03795 [Kiloniellales bacterium]|jgi:hypothetical protein|nr:hypothetical protein [Kiloniellales bacterium]